MWTSLRTEVKILLKSPQTIVVLLLIPLGLITVLSKAFQGEAERAGHVNAYQGTVPRFSILFAFFGMASAAEALFRERTYGNWPRLLSLPVDRWRLLVGKLLAPVVVVLMQLTVLFAFGAIAFGVKLGNVLLLAVVAVCIALAASAGGILLGSVARTGNEVQQISNVVALVLAAIGGALVPVEQLPGVLKAVAPLSPHKWALQALKAVMEQHGGVAQIVGPCAFLLGFAALLAGLGATTFRFEKLLRPA